jgi:UDP-GlcNAc:undecaprenyl-phosphate/decaprenyl-phosphate GlcNAc-1-phosphate transferase
MVNFFLSFLTAALVTPLVIWFYKKHGWVEDPQQKKHVKVTHQHPVPRGGGLVIFFAVTIIALFTLHIDHYLVSILIGAALLTIVGVLDDIYDLSPFIRLGTGLIAALIVVGAGIGIAYVTHPFAPGVLRLDQPQLQFSLFGQPHTIWLLADALAVIFILWNMNIVNWSKGVDGQMPGFVAIALVFIGLLSRRFIDDPSQFNTAYLSFIVAGAFAGFLLWNFYPQKIMSGYGAGSLAGYFLAVLAILSGAKIATTMMVLGIPTADALFTIARRLLAGKSPFWGDRGHLHHKLMDVLGWGRRRIAVFYWLTTFIMGFLSLYLNTLGKLVTMGTVLTLVFGFLIWAKLQTIKVENARKHG